MEEALRTAAADDWRETLARSVQTQRERARDGLATRQQKLRELEAGLASRLDELAQQLAEQQTGADLSASELAAREAALAARKAALDDERTARLGQLGDRQKLLDAADRELQARTAALAEREIAVKSKSDELAARGEKVAAEKAATDETRQGQETRAREHQEQLADLRRQRHELDAEREQLAARERETQRQRRHIAQQLRAQRQELNTEADLHRAEALASASGQELQLQMRLSELQNKYEKLRDEQSRRESDRADAGERAADLSAQLAARQQELSQQHTATDQAEAQRSQLQAQVQQLQEELTAARAAPKADPDAERELATLQVENRKLEKLLAAAEKQVKEAAQGGGAGTQEFDDLRRRFEMALQDLREQKTKNAELSEQVAKTNDQLAKAKRGTSAGGGSGAAAGGALDWESQKRRLLEQLESDFDETDEQQQKDKLTVQGAIKITDEVVAERDKEIYDLRQLLQNQSQNVGDVAVGAAAIAQILDHDELLSQQRERVQQLEMSLREQLKKAEVDISVERAKVARDRAELDEKIRQFESERAKHPLESDTTPGSKGKAQPQARGKWLARLGLGEGKED